MEKLINEIKEWVAIKDSEASILSFEYKTAKNEGYGELALSQIHEAYAIAAEQRTNLRKALIILT